jgi:hypothetical protein
MSCCSGTRALKFAVYLCDAHATEAQDSPRPGLAYLSHKMGEPLQLFSISLFEQAVARDALNLYQILVFSGANAGSRVGLRVFAMQWQSDKWHIGEVYDYDSAVFVNGGIELSRADQPGRCDVGCDFHDCE